MYSISLYMHVHLDFSALTQSLAVGANMCARTSQIQIQYICISLYIHISVYIVEGTKSAQSFQASQ